VPHVGERRARAAHLRALAEWTSIGYVDKVCSCLPLKGLRALFLPDPNGRMRLPKYPALRSRTEVRITLSPKRKRLRNALPEGDDAVAAICAVIRRIPKGWVATYGQVATMAGLPKRARLVGHILQHLNPTSNIPWHRVVNARGEVSYSVSRNGSDALQRRLLEKEGVEFDDKNRLNLEHFRWLD
jgi:methylated-DNA-protein-cysteine methyltransferase related protein